METRIPIRLEQDPIIESVFEVRFSSSEKEVSELLPGMIFGKLKSKFPKFENLPVKQIPKEIRQQDPDLRYRPLVSLQGDSSKVQIGDHLFSLHIKRPYIGWDEKKKLISILIDCLKGTGLIETVERFSLKYVNIIPSEPDADNVFPSLKVGLQLGDLPVTDQGLHIRSEASIGGVNVLINIIPSAYFMEDGEKIKGAVLDVDAIKDLGVGNDLDSILSYLDEVHEIEKTVFFGLLKPETINKMGPTWE
ncbi:MAG: TIGR04255 family protein [Gammaproteobacteria bacterium]|nr:TIGR04255 family protein [Gammaproteobacteria bacterium]